MLKSFFICWCLFVLTSLQVFSKHGLVVYHRKEKAVPLWVTLKCCLAVTTNCLSCICIYRYEVVQNKKHHVNNLKVCEHQMIHFGEAVTFCWEIRAEFWDAKRFWIRVPLRLCNCHNLNYIIVTLATFTRISVTAICN